MNEKPDCLFTPMKIFGLSDFKKQKSLKLRSVCMHTVNERNRSSGCQQQSHAFRMNCIFLRPFHLMRTDDKVHKPFITALTHECRQSILVPLMVCKHESSLESSPAQFQTQINSHLFIVLGQSTSG